MEFFTGFAIIVWSNATCFLAADFEPRVFVWPWIASGAFLAYWASPIFDWVL